MIIPLLWEMSLWFLHTENHNFISFDVIKCPVKKVTGKKWCSGICSTYDLGLYSLKKAVLPACVCSLLPGYVTSYKERGRGHAQFLAITLLNIIEKVTFNTHFLYNLFDLKYFLQLYFPYYLTKNRRFE